MPRAKPKLKPTAAPSAGKRRHERADAPEPDEYATFAFLLDELAGELRVNDSDERLEDFCEIEPAALREIADQLDSLPDIVNDELEASKRAWGAFAH